MSDRPLRRLSAKPVLRVEEIDDILERFRLEMSGVAADLAEATAPDTDSAGRADVPDLSESADQVLRAWLEEETLALIEPEGPRGIEEHELNHEILKKALVTLKRDVLRDIAASKRLEPATKLDDLAQQVARAYGWDESAIARLILDYTETPQEVEGGFSTRIFTLREPADLDYMSGRLDYVDGRYYRTDIAKWFVFNKYRRVGSVLRVNGTLQSYKATVDPATEDRMQTERDASECRLEARDGSPIVQIHQAKNHSVARSMLAALKVATRAQTSGYVPNSGDGAAVVSHRLHPSTVFVLDIITHRMRGYLFRERNPILARFRLGARPDLAVDAATSRRPTLRAVRFEGENLLDSPTACGLMWTEGRPLVDVTLSVVVTESETDSTIRARVPIRIALERDCVLIQTGLVSDSTLAAEVHRTTVGHVEAAMSQAVSPEREAALERKIRVQAENPDPDADAQLLADELSNDGEESS